MKNAFILSSILLLLFISCEKDDVPIDTKKAILGKWELVQQGTSLENLTDVPPNGYTEFLDESTYRFYDYNTKKFDYGDYTMNDSLLIYYYYTLDLGIIDTIEVKYYHTYRNQKTLVLDIEALAIIDFFIYKKIGL